MPDRPYNPNPQIGKALNGKFSAGVTLSTPVETAASPSAAVRPANVPASFPGADRALGKDGIVDKENEGNEPEENSDESETKANNGRGSTRFTRFDSGRVEKTEEAVQREREGTGVQSLAPTSNPNKVEHRPDGVSVLTLERRDGTTEFCYIDTVDYPLVKNYRWGLRRNHQVLYARADIHRDGKRLVLPMHRLIFPLADGQTVDHKDFDGLNNRRSNLRPATQSQQNTHRRKREFTSSQFRGVSWYEPTKKFNAKITTDKRILRLGYFNSEDAAARAYDAAARKYYGEFAILNFPNEGAA